MNRFVVYLPDGEGVLERHFPNNHVLNDDLWAIAASEFTCAEISEKLGIQTPSGGDRTGVVFRIEDYYGFFDRALWEKLNAWQYMS